MTVEYRKFEVYERDGSVVIDAGGDERVVFSPPQAVHVAQALLNAATACGYEVEIRLPKLEVSEEKRRVFVTRVSHIMRSSRHTEPGNVFVASQIVDTILAALL